MSKGGAPANNRNALKNGKRAIFSSGSFPKGAEYIARLGRDARRKLEQAVTDTYGSVSLTRADIINNAVRAEMSALIVQRWLREGDLTSDQQLAHIREFRSATAARSKAIKELGLDERDHVIEVPNYAEVWDAEKQRQEATNARHRAEREQRNQTHTDTTEGHSGPQSASESEERDNG